MARGDARGALEDFVANGTMIAPYGESPAVARWRPYAAIAAHGAGDTERARRLSDEALAIAEAFELDVEIAVALYAQAMIGDPADALATLERSAALLEGRDADLDRAKVLLELGRLLRTADRLEEARTALREALALAERTGALAAQARAREELIATGAKPRRAAISGVAALTPSELRIADLVAAGHTNREIAERLFLTKNTVEWHLRHVYQKLGTRSRTALGDLIDSPTR
jgi:DNA-binding CsgD family transcriptional regulator